MTGMVGAFTATILAAGWTTLLLAVASLAVATVLGMAAAFAKLSGNRLLRSAASLYTFVVRGIPDLVVMLLIYYSLPALLNQWIDAMGIDARIEFPPIIAGIATLGLIFGAYMTETFKTALQNIPRGQIEAAIAYGLTRRRMFACIILPQLVRLALPGFTNNWLVLAKATALVSLIGLQDVMFRAKGAAEATGMPFTFYLVAAGFYLLVTILSLLLLGLAARRFEIGLRELAP
ncbi:lysine/arginine/ornithine ABC transporter/histidine ABC transporter, membrane subunit HisQ (plasmid) [Shinella sp. WSC3-e]|nr:lysine/arginine/ornithine ABC transporter/histidine ABC transporter, membrane subunit HisQ [Rhizobiaceae bacterium]CAK7260618.1 lysine/arginine/ornithine ABC transporter/histidine ABC transporter, membrane subunit HisQ [Shinella sp. WSC3-e]